MRNSNYTSAELNSPSLGGGWREAFGGGRRGWRRLLFLFLLLGSTLTHAQVGERRTDFAIGGNAGFTMNRISFMPTIKQGWRAAPTFGFTARYISEKYFTCICGLQAEVNYANMGWKEVIEDGSGNTFSADLHYIQLPLLMQLGWGRERLGAKFIFEAGPQLGFCIGTGRHMGGGTWDTSQRPNGVTHQYEHDIDHKFDYGITAGLGLELSTKVGHFLLEGRYYYGLGDVYDNSKKGFFDRSAHGSIVVKLNYLFGLKRTKNDNIK